MIYLYTLYIFSNLGALTLRCCCSPCLSLDFVAVAVAAIVPAFGGSVGCLLGREAAWRWNEGAPRCFRFTDIHSWKPCTRRAQRRVAPTRLRWGSAMCMSVLSCVPDRVLPKAPYSGFGNSIQLCQASCFQVARMAREPLRCSDNAVWKETQPCPEVDKTHVDEGQRFEQFIEGGWCQPR